MEKKCFVIMPISDNENYPSGHFDRVYEHIIKPACEKAGFKPLRADEVMTTNYIALDIIKQIIGSEMALCDLSSRNPNVLYELGIRQAFNLPVTLIKDTKTSRVFDIQGFRDIEYDETLRIDNVQETIDTLSEILKNTYENKNEVNSLVSLLGIEPAKLTNKKKISADTELILNTIIGLEKRMFEIEGKIRPTEFIKATDVILPTNLGEAITIKDIDSLKIGDEVYHPKFGKGIIKGINVRGSNLSNTSVEVSFTGGSTKSLLLALAKLYRMT